MRIMITIHFDKQHFATILSLIPAEQEHIKELTARGIVETIYISADRTVVWLIMKGESQEQIEQELHNFPLYTYMKSEFVPLM
jgi:muconolactone delta-isomerase